MKISNLYAIIILDKKYANYIALIEGQGYFFGWIMLKFGKEYTLKSISILLIALLLILQPVVSQSQALNLRVATGDYSRMEEFLNPNQLYKRLEAAIANKTSISPDDQVASLLYLRYKDYFDHHPDLNPMDIELTEEILLQIIRDLFNPFFERRGFRVFDFFSGTGVPPVLLSWEELEKVGYEGGRLYAYGIDNKIGWALVSAKDDNGIIRMDVMDLVGPASTIPRACVDLVTVFKPEHLPEEEIFATVDNVAPIVKAAKRVLKPGGWIYITPAPQLNHKNDHHLFKKALEDHGFVHIEVIPHPGISLYRDAFRFYYDTTKPNYLVRAQKPSEKTTLTSKDRAIKEETRFLFSEVGKEDKALIRRIIEIDNLGNDIEKEAEKENFEQELKGIETGMLRLIAITHREDSAVIGYALYQSLGDNKIYIHRVSIITKYQKQGILRMLLEDFKGRFDYVSMHLVLDEPYELEFKKRVSDMYKGLGFEEKEEDYFAWERSNDTEGLGQTPASIASVDTAPYYVTEITDEGEMAGTLDRWFSSQEERYFDRPDWRVSLKRPNSVMFRL